jgi:hypothetical protein
MSWVNICDPPARRAAVNLADVAARQVVHRQFDGPAIGQRQVEAHRIGDRIGHDLHDLQALAPFLILFSFIVERPDTCAC